MQLKQSISTNIVIFDQPLYFIDIHKHITVVVEIFILSQYEKYVTI
jgi:hypothetical protein